MLVRKILIDGDFTESMGLIYSKFHKEFISVGDGNPGAVMIYRSTSSY